MARRKLTRHQTDRIRRARETQARQVRQAENADTPTGEPREGLVVAHYGTQVDVVPDTAGTPPASRHRCHLRAHLESLVPGDRVIWQPGPDTGVITGRLERDSELLRPDSEGRLKPVAANVDRLVIVIAPRPEPHANLLDRYLVAAETQGIEPLILLNKSDWLTADHPVYALLRPYGPLGYTVQYASCRTGDGLATLRTALAGHTSVFVGQSGVGKSSLINALLPEANARVGALSTAAAKGRHTTTTAELFFLPDGGRLIDSPGIREFHLTHITPEALATGFREFRPWLGGCRFRNCRHENEPGCLITAAAADGRIDARRHASYCRILATLDHARA